MPRMLLLKTDKSNLLGVVTNQKHATDAVPTDLVPGDWLLIQTDATTREEAKVRYIMDFVKIYEDTLGETTKIWGRPWRYIIQGGNIRKLKNPINVNARSITKKSYGQGAIKYAYIDPRDAEEFMKKGYLETILP